MRLPDGLRLATVLVGVALLGAAPGCATDLNVDQAPCPCLEGWLCCDGGQVCVQDRADCPRSRPTDAEPALVATDVLFVVDNSGSMAPHQADLAAKMGSFVDAFVDGAVSFRIGVVSTDTHGFIEDCDGVPFDAPEPRSRGNCDRPEVVVDPRHDGARGRLIAAYDPQLFERAAFAELTDGEFSLLSAIAPRPDAMPYVVDSSKLRSDACWVCGCGACGSEDACYSDCARGLIKALATAEIRSNLAGLGTSGFGYEAGLEAVVLATGAVLDGVASGLTEPGAANSYVGSSWLRDAADLTVLLMSDEQDCSMPVYVYDSRHAFEWARGLPDGSMCYQEDASPFLYSPRAVAESLAARKGGSIADVGVAVGFVGGVAQEEEAWTGADYALDSLGTPQECTCWSGAAPGEEDAWCALTLGTDPNMPACDVLAGSRYAEFAGLFPRHAFATLATGFSSCLPSFVALASGSEVAAACTGPFVNSPEPPAVPGCDECEVTDLDTDGDCIADALETRSDPHVWDTDGDGTSDGCEDRDCDGELDPYEMDPASPDTDGDGIGDGIEDANHNGLRDVGETSAVRSDSDYDGIADGDEDRDHDGVVDPWVDINGDGCWQPGEPAGESDPRSPDSDGDLIADHDEDQDRDGVCDPGETCAFSRDSDCDGLFDGIEDRNHNGARNSGETDPRNPDSDADGLPDGIEDANHNGARNFGETDPLDPDSDGDGLLDGVEDADHDGIVDQGETDPLRIGTDTEGRQLCRRDKVGTCPLGSSCAATGVCEPFACWPTEAEAATDCAPTLDCCEAMATAGQPCCPLGDDPLCYYEVITGQFFVQCGAP